MWRRRCGNTTSCGEIEVLRRTGSPRDHASPAACRRRSSRSTNSSAEMCVAPNTTCGALPCSKASFQRSTQRHQRSPLRSPGNSYSGLGVLRSFPIALENSRNASLITAQTVCNPTSPGPVRQHPSRKKPVRGLWLQSASGSPNTFLARPISFALFALPRHPTLLNGWPWSPGDPHTPRFSAIKIPRPDSAGSLGGKNPRSPVFGMLADRSCGRDKQRSYQLLASTSEQQESQPHQGQ